MINGLDIYYSKKVSRSKPITQKADGLKPISQKADGLKPISKGGSCKKVRSGLKILQ